MVEDAKDWIYEGLEKEGFSKQVLDALRSVTKITEDENYDHFIDRALGDLIGRQVKIANIKDNLDVTRIGELTE